MSERDRTRYARCPGCGDNGDVEHMAACFMSYRREHALAVTRSYDAGWLAGAITVVDWAGTQLARRGVVSVSTLWRAMGARVASMSVTRLRKFGRR